MSLQPEDSGFQLPRPEDLDPFKPRTQPHVSDYMGSPYDPDKQTVVPDAFCHFNRQTGIGWRADEQTLGLVTSALSGILGAETSLSAQVWLQSEGTEERVRDYKESLLRQVEILNVIGELSGIDLRIED